jgi:hypothetical protein
MSNSSIRKRGGTFHLDEEEDGGEDANGVQFVTPYYDEGNMPELDLSKLCLDDDLFEKDGKDDTGPDSRSQEEESDAPTRGRSRSRSVHENDLAATAYIPDSTSGTENKTFHSNLSKDNGSSHTEEKPAGRKGGPLQQKELQALKKVNVVLYSV